MEYRKVQLMGGSTILISLPRKWATRHNVRKGDSLAVEERVDGTLVVSTSSDKPTEKTEVSIPYSGSELDDLIDDITSQYLLGHDLIRVVSEGRFTLEERQRVKDLVRRLVGLEIIEEDTGSLTIQCLLEHTSLDPRKLLVRMHILTSALHRDAIASLIEGDTHLSRLVESRDDEIDRLYFLVVRLLRSAVQKPSLADSYGLSPIDCLDFRVAATLIENMADLATEIARTAATIAHTELSRGLLSHLNQISVTLEELQEKAVSVFLGRSKDHTQSVMTTHGMLEEKLSDLDKLIQEHSLEVITPLSLVRAAVETIAHNSVDINDLVVSDTVGGRIGPQ